MYVIEYSKSDSIWTVGFYDHEGAWTAEEDFASQSEARAFVNYLNGGDGKSFVYRG